MRYQEIVEARKDFEQNHLTPLLPDTEQNIAAAKQFVLEKMIERFHERYGDRYPNDVPTDLTDSCKFSSMFARIVFGGRLRGNIDHQYVEARDGKIIDLNIDAKDVQQMGERAHLHDRRFWGNREHREAMASCAPRVERWVEEFMSRMRT